jgi:hypothetical protein
VRTKAVCVLLFLTCFLGALASTRIRLDLEGRATKSSSVQIFSGKRSFDVTLKAKDRFCVLDGEAIVTQAGVKSPLYKDTCLEIPTQAVKLKVVLNGYAGRFPAGKVLPGPLRDYPMTLNPGDRLCVEEGKAVLTNGAKVTNLRPNECYFIRPPRSLWESLVTFGQGKIEQSYFIVPGVARGCDDPASCKTAFRYNILLPTHYNAQNVRLPISGQPKSLRLIDQAGVTLLELVLTPEQNEVFSIPTAILRLARRVEVKDGDTLLYAGGVYSVAFDTNPNTSARQQAAQLLATKDPSYAVIVFNYLLQAGLVKEAASTEAYIRKTFIGDQER